MVLVSGQKSKSIVGHSKTEGGEMTKNETLVINLDSEDDEYDIAEENCELAMVEGQLCNIPYEVYDLSDLTGVLSIEAWSSVLMEEERFFLSCFLPDMDGETFSETMQELLGGANLCFGNPVDTFYKNMRGGLFTPEVSCFKEGVMFLKRRKYYYSLKFYHENLVKTFTEMQRLFDLYGEELGSYTRLLLWSERRKRGKLQKLPSKTLERKRTESLTFPCGDSSTNTLKFKITEKGVFQYHSPPSFVSSQQQQQRRILPNGILKVIPKPSPSVVLEEPYLAQTDSTSTRFAASPYLGSAFENPYGSIACSITGLPNYLLMNHQDASFRYLETRQRSSTIKTEPVFYDPRGLGASYFSITEQNLRTKQEEYLHYHLKSPGFKLDTGSIKKTEPMFHDTSFRGHSASHYSFTEHNLSTKREEYLHYHLKSPGFNPAILDTGSEQMETKHVLSGKNLQRKPLHALSGDNHARETNDDPLCSLTYKRRKIQLA